MNRGPTLDQLRRRVFKHSAPDGRGRPSPEVGHWLARRVGRPSAVYGTWAAVRLGVGAHAVTALALAANLGAAAAIGSGARAGFVAGVALAWLAYWLDHVDGQVARWRGTASLGGVYLDYMMHHASTLALGFALGHGLAARTGLLAWATAGWLVGAGLLLLGLGDDCRYKAFFQRLKCEAGRYRVRGGSDGHAASPDPRPTRGLRRWTWPLLKACEPQGVLLSITALGLLALAPGDAWARAWTGYVAALAVVAPALAVGRAAKATLHDKPGAEFLSWFRPEDDPAA